MTRDVFAHSCSREAPPPPASSRLLPHRHLARELQHPPHIKKKRNLHITYTPLPSIQPCRSQLSPQPQRLGAIPNPHLRQDQTIQGTDTPSDEDRNWRGNGRLKVESSHWEFVDWSNEWGEGEE
ncbi:MAG: hypothetical protein Q9199_003053 [Rusavskia elegans]